MSVEIRKYETEGYVLLHDLFSKEQVAAIKSEIRNTLQAGTSDGHNDFTKNGVFVGLSKKNSVLREAADHPPMVKALEEIKGCKAFFVSDKVVAKSAGTDFGTPWHQDRAYWQGKDRISVWIALDDAYIDNGCLKVVTGSNLSGEYLHSSDAADDIGFKSRINPKDINENEVTAVEVKAGGAIIFHDLLYHASYPNVSGKDRWSLVSTYEFFNER